MLITDASVSTYQILKVNLVNFDDYFHHVFIFKNTYKDFIKQPHSYMEL